jgi:hypothetical protein
MPCDKWFFSDKLVCGNICNVYEVFDDVEVSVYLKNHDYLGNLKLHSGKSKITFADWSTRENYNSMKHLYDATILQIAIALTENPFVS